MANAPTYTYVPGSGLPRDRVRLMIPDRPVVRANNKPPAMFSDQEIADFLAEYGDPQLAAAGACEVVAMDEAKRQLSVSVSSGFSISRNGAQLWLTKAKQMRESAGKVPWEIVESASIDITKYGEDNSHYIGDPEEE